MMSRIHSSARWMAPLIALLAGWSAFSSGMSREAAITLGVAIVTALWWMLEAVPIPVASLVPIALLPLLGVLPVKTVAQSYGHELVLLLLGGFLLSKAMEKSGVHRRLALGMVRISGGGGPKGVMLGFMLASAALSMWISNTAATLMLLPIAMAVLGSGRREDGSVNPLAAPLMMGIAYASSIGGLGTPIGTPPNLVFIAQYEKLTGTVVTFTDWMKFGVPVVVVMIPLMWLWLSRGQSRSERVVVPASGPWRAEEWRTLVIFGLTAAAWITREEPSGGWSKWLELPGANDASVAFVGVLLFFVLPDGSGRAGERGRLLDWETAREIPWGILLLFSGGICLAEGFRVSGLSDRAAGLLSGVGTLPVVGIIFTICLLMTFLTEVTSNTASTILMMPILGAVAVANHLDPKLLMLPAALSASCAFMLPVATAPNAVVFGTGHIAVPRMVREGLVLNFIGVAVIGVCCWLMA